MSSTEATEVAKAYMEKVFVRFGASDSIRHDRDPRFMSEVFRQFNRMLKQNQLATLSYRPQANGQQERSIQTMMKSVKTYIEEIDQSDWDEYAEALTFSINSSYDTVRKDTPFYLVHGWDPKSTLEMVTSLNVKRASKAELREELAEPAVWRRRIYRHHQMADEIARELQKAQKKERAEKHNEKIKPGPGYEEGDRVWLYIDQVKPGYNRKLAHRWHGPFRIKRRIDEIRYELVLPDRHNYRFHPRVHVSRLKRCYDQLDRPSVALTIEDPESRMDFDEELLPEDSFERELEENEYEVVQILDRREVKRTRHNKKMIQYLVKWAGDYPNSWENIENLTCAGLINDFHRRRKQENSFAQAQIADEDQEQ
jgi:hypothetical protein